MGQVMNKSGEQMNPPMNTLATAKPRTKSKRRLSDIVKPARVHRDIYLDESLFQEEMAKIFERNWVYVGHESEIPRPGDYKTIVLGRVPAIIARGSADGIIRGFFNSCRHRGATVCAEEYGSRTRFMCPYHGWTYHNDGRLAGVPFREGYGPSLDGEDLGLLPLAAVESFHGFLFARVFEHGGPGLVDHLASAGEILARFGPGGATPISVLTPPQRFRHRANWKLSAENITDGYHASFTHAGFVQAKKTVQGLDVPLRGAWKLTGLGNGHGIIDFGSGNEHNRDNAINMLVFPNMLFLGVSVRIIRPIAVDSTQTSFFPTVVAGAPEDETVARLRGHTDLYGPMGMVSADDASMFERIQRGLQKSANEWLLLVRGTAEDHRDAEGRPIGMDATDELGQREFYRQYSTRMNGVRF